MKLIFCILLVATVFGASLRGFNNQNGGTQHMLNFANTFTQIRSMIHSGGPYEDVYALIDGIKDQLVNEQNSEFTTWTDQMADCDTEQTMRRGEVSEAVSAQFDANVQKVKCDESLTNANLVHTSLSTAKTQKDGQLVLETALRTSQAAVYTHFEAELTAQLLNIDTAINYVRTLTETVSTETMTPYLLFTQMSSKLAKNAIISNSFEQMTPVFVAMASLVNQDYGVVGAEGDHVSQLTTLLTELRTGTQATYDANQVEENNRITAYNSNTGVLNTAINGLIGEIAQVELQQEDMASCISTEGAIITSAFTKQTRNQGILDAAILMCDAFDSEYQIATTARESEMGLLTALRALVESELSGSIGGSALVRASADDTDWETADLASNYDYVEPV